VEGKWKGRLQGRCCRKVGRKEVEDGDKTTQQQEKGKKLKLAPVTGRGGL
jgi:hypothetical protein